MFIPQTVLLVVGRLPLSVHRNRICVPSQAKMCAIKRAVLYFIHLTEGQPREQKNGTDGSRRWGLTQIGKIKSLDVKLGWICSVTLDSLWLGRFQGWSHHISKFLPFVIKAIVYSHFEGLLQQQPQLPWKNTAIKQANADQSKSRVEIKKKTVKTHQIRLGALPAISCCW